MSETKPRQPRRWTTEAQREAARRNGAKSNGPTTPAGKSRASRNNLGLGLNTQTLDLSTDPNYEAKFRDHINKFLLPDNSNLAEVEALVSASLRRRKLNSMDARLFNTNFDPAHPFSFELVSRELEQIAKAEYRESATYIRLLRYMQNQKSNSNPTTTQTQSQQQHIRNSAPLNPRLIHIFDSITKSYD